MPTQTPRKLRHDGSKCFAEAAPCVESLPDGDNLESERPALEGDRSGQHFLVPHLQAVKNLKEPHRAIRIARGFYIVRQGNDVGIPCLEPVALSLDQNRYPPAADPRRYRVTHYPFIRIIWWLNSFDRLNQTQDFQAVGAGACSIFENYLDLRWLESFPEEIWFERFRAYADVSRYQAAEKVVKHSRESPASNIDATAQAAFIQRMDAMEPVAKIVGRVWGVKDGKPLWPKDHWTGAGNLRDRAKKLGPECENAYVQIYPTLSMLTHSGPTIVHGEIAWWEQQAAFSYVFAFKHALDAVMTMDRIFELSDAINGFDGKILKLRLWMDQAFVTLP